MQDPFSIILHLFTNSFSAGKKENAIDYLPFCAIIIMNDYVH